MWLHSSVQYYWAFLHEYLALPATLVTLAATFYQFTAGCMQRRVAVCTTLAAKTNSPDSMSNGTLLVRVILVAGRW